MSEIEPQFEAALQEYCTYFEKLSARSVRLIEKLVEPSMRFKDPFNDVQGVDHVERVLASIFEHAEKAKFKVKDTSWGRVDEPTAYIRWRFSYVLKGRALEIEGMSEVLFSKGAKVMSHIDYWDTGEYVYPHVPVLGRVIGYVKSRLKVL